MRAVNSFKPVRKVRAMPNLISRQCSTRGCPNAAETGSKCAEHAKARHRDINQLRDKLSKKFYNSQRWKEMRINYLFQNPLCAGCLKNGRTANAEQVDHIKPHRGDVRLFFNWQNLQGLCASCHSRKTMMEINERGVR